MDNPEKPVT